MYNPFSLKGKTILVTGASSGIGRTTAIECSRLGARVIITARNIERLQETFLQMTGTGHQIFQADLSDVLQLDSLVESVECIDGLVNNAGIVKTLPVQFINKESLQQVLDVNTIAPLILMQKLIKKRKIGKGASVVFTSSIAGLYRCTIGNSIYSTSKAAVCGFVKNSALDLANKNIRVNAVCPGMIETGILDEGTISEEQLILDKQKYPMKRYGRPEEIAYAIIYLLSDASTFTTGSLLVIDGGLTLG